MPQISVNSALKKINAGEIDSCYYLSGWEKFFHDQISDLLIQKIFPDKGGRDLNLLILYGSECSLSDILSAAVSYPMLSDRKLIIVREFNKMKITDAEELEKYLLNPVKSTCLVLASQEAGRSKIFKTIQSHTCSVDCRPIPEYKTDDWIKEHTRQKGYSIEAGAVQFLVNNIGASLLNLNQEIEKIISFKNDDTPITVDDLEQTTGLTKEYGIFALQNALSARQTGNSLRISQRLIESGENINAIIAVLFAYFRKMLIAASLRSKGNNASQIRGQMQLSEYQARGILRALSNFSLLQIKQVIAILQDTDMGVKTSAFSDGPGLQMLCYRICNI